MKSDDIEVGQLLLVMSGPCEALHGVPVHVVAISRPYIAVQYDGETHCLCLVEYSFVKCDRRYARVYDNRGPKVRRKKKQKLDPRCCPRCGERLKQRLDNKTRKWFMTCEKCGYR